MAFWSVGKSTISKVPVSTRVLYSSVAASHHPSAWCPCIACLKVRGSGNEAEFTALSASSSSSTTCASCGSSGHSQDVCRQYTCAKDQVGKNRNNRKKDKANAAQTPETPSEFAGNASAPSTSPSPIPPNFDSLAATGATSHMTPHHHWVRNYLPLRIPIRLADNNTVYSSGVGTVLFNPVMMDGKPSQPVEFTRVLSFTLILNKWTSA